MSWIAAAATIYGASQAGRGGGAQQVGTQTTKTEAPDYIKPQYERLAADIGSIRDRGLLEDVQRLSDYERGLVQTGMARAAGVDPFQAAGERAVSQLLGGGGLLGEAADIYRGATGSTMESPEFMAAGQRAVERAMRPITSQFAAGGRLGSTAFADALANASVSAFAPLALQARQQDISADLNRASGLGSLAGQRTRDIGAGLTGAGVVGDMPFTNIQRGLGLGGLLSGEEFAIRQAPVTGAQRYADLVRGATVGSQQTQPLYAPSTGSMSAGAIMSAAPQIGQAVSNLAQGFGNFFNSPPPPAPYNTGVDLSGSYTAPTVDFSDLYFNTGN